MSRKHVEAQPMDQLEVFSLCTPTEIEWLNQNNTMQDEHLQRLKYLYDYSSMEVDVIELGPQANIKPFYPRVPQAMMKWIQLDGRAVIRLGGWKQRQDSHTMEAGEGIQIEGPGKRSMENPDKGSCFGLLVQIIPVERSPEHPVIVNKEMVA